MALVGPRPEHPEWVAHYTREQRRVLLAKPGITSPASITYRDEESRLVGLDAMDYYRRTVLPAKLAMDLAYLEVRTIRSDLVVLVRTALGLRLGRRMRRNLAHQSPTVAL
jgi:lipopolysaccharide/colanic/teichoic acid biosynthesis glycosyltransferase